MAVRMRVANQELDEFLESHPEHTGVRRGTAYSYVLFEDSEALEMARLEREGVSVTDSAFELARENGINLRTVEGTGADGKIVKADVQAELEG